MMPAPNLQRKLNSIPKDYPALRRRVEETLLLGQRQIEETKVKTYWQTGKLINEHILHHDNKDNYGRQIIERLSGDLEVSASVLWRCVRFAQCFKILAARQESLHLSWAHYRELITVPDEETRRELGRRAAKSGWTSRELARKIHEEIRDPVEGGNGKLSAPPPPKLIPRKGQVYTYRLIAPDSVHKDDDRLWIDLGFQVHHRLPSTSRNLKEGQIIETLKQDGDYGVTGSDRKEADLFTYYAFVERVIDGDTLLVKIDLGFETRVRQYLRLRGINAPELDTPEGKKAKTFVERELAKVPYITLTSSRSDKYDRYLADVYYGEGEKERYLNQMLLDESLADRY
jgi:endonuclease YncB( thermonuclease family)